MLCQFNILLTNDRSCIFPHVRRQHVQPRYGYKHADWHVHVVLVRRGSCCLLMITYADGVMRGGNRGGGTVHRHAYRWLTHLWSNHPLRRIQYCCYSHLVWSIRLPVWSDEDLWRSNLVACPSCVDLDWPANSSASSAPRGIFRLCPISYLAFDASTLVSTLYTKIRPLTVSIRGCWLISKNCGYIGSRFPTVLIFLSFGLRILILFD